MATTTPNLGLTKPTVGADADAWGGQLNASLDTLDSKVLDKTTGGTVSGAVNVIAATTAPAVRITQTGAGEALRVEDEANPDATPFVIDAAGNVGVGTGAPGAKLDVNGRGRFFGDYVSFGDNGYIRTDAPNILRFQPGASGYQFRDASNSDNLAVLDSAGNLGLGVTPSAWRTNSRAFQLGASSAIEGLTNNGSYVALYSNAFNNGTNFIYQNTAAAALYQHSLGTHAFFTAPSGTAGTAITFTQAMTLTQGGNLLVGTTTDGGERIRATQTAGGTAFRVTDGATTDVKVVLTANQGTSLINEGNAYLAFGTSNTERARITSAGDFLIANTVANGTPSQGFQFVAGGASTQYIGHANGSASGSSYIEFDYNSVKIGSITQNGTTAVLYNTTSDYRLKDFIAKVTDAGSRIDALNPVEYEWKSDGKRTRGFFAHEFQAVYADSVTGTKDAVDEEGKPVYQSMQAGSSEVIADLVAEIQSLRKRLAALEAK